MRPRRCQLGLAALDCGGKALTKDLSWTVANAETDIAQIVWKNGVPQSVRGIGAGETTTAHHGELSDQ